MSQFPQNEKFSFFMQKVGKPLFQFGQKLASETIPAFGAKFIPEKWSKRASNIGSTAVGSVVAATSGLIALQTPITMVALLSIGSLMAWPVIFVSTLAIGVGATAATLIGAGMAYSGAQGIGLVRGVKNDAGKEFNGVGASAAGFNPDQDFVGASPTNDNKRFATVNTAPEGKTTFGEGLEAKDSFTRAKNGTTTLKADEQKIAATGAAPAKKNQPKPPYA